VTLPFGAQASRIRRAVRRRPKPATRLGVVVHAFHPELLRELARRLTALEQTPPVFLTTTAERHAEVERHLDESSLAAEITIVDNLGRDVWPFLQTLGRCERSGCNVILKLHTKQTGHRHDGDRWRTELLDALLDPPTVARVLDAFATDPTVGIAGPASHRLSILSFMGGNAERVNSIAHRLGIDHLDPEDSFFAGTMFYVRLEALAPLRSLRLAASDFEPEAGQVDGTLAHALERCFSLSAAAAGLTVRDTASITESRPSSGPLHTGYPFARETRTSDP
jgi:lipopolysaccharide biosynthesis protein